MVDYQLLWCNHFHSNSLKTLMLNIIDDSQEPVWNCIVLTKIISYEKRFYQKCFQQ